MCSEVLVVAVVVVMVVVVVDHVEWQMGMTVLAPLLATHVWTTRMHKGRSGEQNIKDDLEKCLTTNHVSKHAEKPVAVEWGFPQA